VHFKFVVQIKDYEGYAHQRLENLFDNAQSESGNIKAAGLLRLGHLLQQRLWVLCGRQLIEVLVQGSPLRTERDRQNNGKPDRGDECAAPQWALKPRKITSAARQIATFTQ